MQPCIQLQHYNISVVEVWIICWVKVSSVNRFSCLTNLETFKNTNIYFIQLYLTPLHFSITHIAITICLNCSYKHHISYQSYLSKFCSIEVVIDKAKYLTGQLTSYMVIAVCSYMAYDKYQITHAQLNSSFSLKTSKISCQEYPIIRLLIKFHACGYFSETAIQVCEHKFGRRSFDKHNNLTSYIASMDSPLSIATLPRWLLVSASCSMKFLSDSLLYTCVEKLQII